MARKYNHLRAEEAYSLIEKYYRSGLSAGVFYKCEGLTEFQFYSWRRRYLMEHSISDGEMRESLSLEQSTNKARKQDAGNASATLGFGKVVVSDASEDEIKDAISTTSIELVYPNGVKMCLPLGISVEQLSSYIKLY